MQFESCQSRTKIQRFYAGQSVLITGGTGFLGKLLIEKLLRCCPDLTSIYVIMRRKKDLTFQDRKKLFSEDPVFNNIKNDDPELLQKMFPIEGDCSLPNLGISKEDKLNLSNNVSIVFHVAASIRFTETLKKSVADNVFGTKELIALCKSMTKLKAVIHVSTFYAHYARTEIDEIFYETPITGDRMLKITEVLHEKEIDVIEKMLTKDYPNNYCFTKAIAEQLIQDAKYLPFGIVRPAIVSSTLEEPAPGWTDNFTGPNGVIVNVISGLLKTMLCDTTKKAEIVPADLTINAIIACAWDVASNKTKKDEAFIYNYISTWTQSITWGEYFNLVFQYEIPLSKALWCSSLIFFKYYWAYKIATIILQTMPAFVADTLLIIFGRKTWAMRTSQKLDKLMKLMAIVPLYEWTGKNERVKSLWDKISPEDRKLFPFSMHNFNWHDYMQKYMLGLRIYLIKDPINTIPSAVIRRSRFLMIRRILKYTLIMLKIMAFYKLLKNVRNLKGKDWSIRGGCSNKIERLRAYITDTNKTLFRNFAII